jgi:type II secretory pathway component PulJ
MNIKKNGFTLVELIAYIALTAIILVGAVNFTMNVIIGDREARGNQEVYANARVVMNQMASQIRNAEDVITGSSTFASHPGVLTLDFTGTGTDVVFDTYTKSVTIGGSSTTIRKLRVKEGSDAAVDLTNDNLDVTNFVVRNLTRESERKNINIELTIQRANPGADSDFAASISLETGVSLRQ